MRTRFWAIGWKGRELWWLLPKTGDLLSSDVGSYPSDILKFQTRERAEGHRFFLVTKHAGEKLGRFRTFPLEDAMVVQVKVDRIINRVRVVKSD